MDKFGYGRLTIYDKKKKQARGKQAHRVSYFAHKGLSYKSRLPLLLHKCDRSFCIHPDHVDPGTHILNMKQMKERGRHGNRWGNVANDYGKLPPVDPEAVLEEREPGSDG